MKHSILPMISFAVSTLSIPNPAITQTQEQWRATENSESQKPPPQSNDEYRGVTPGRGNTLPKVTDLNNRPGIWVTWPGFSMLPDGASHLFLQTTSSLSYKIKQAGNTYIIELGKASVYLGNNRNPLVTTHFNTPLKRAYFKTKRKRLSLILEMKSEVQPELSQTTQQDGYNYLFIKFPPWTPAPQNMP